MTQIGELTRTKTKTRRAQCPQLRHKRRPCSGSSIEHLRSTPLTLAASLIPFEPNALITELTIDDYADTYGLIRGVSQHC
ncbi:hypothetical protein PI126_g17195 [Phytophthora idaei]|nr:hypothetical protein PI126_g17195 [Phytophthora idaei]